MDMEGENVKLKRRLAEQEEEIRRGMEEWAVEIRSLDEQREKLQAKLVSVEESHNDETQKNIHLEQELQAAARRIEVLDQMAKNATVEETQHTSLKIELKATKDRLDGLLSEMAQKDSECQQLRQLLQEEQQQAQQARFAQHAHDSVVKSLNAQIDFMADRIAAYEEDELRANEVELQLKKLQRQVKKLTAERDGLIQELESDSPNCKAESQSFKKKGKNRQPTDAAFENPAGKGAEEITSLVKENTDLREMLDASTKVQNELKMKIERLESDVNTRKQMLSEKNARDERMEAETIAELRGKIEDAESACTALEKQLDENTKFHKQEKQSLERRICDLNALLDSDQVEIAELKNLIASLDEASTSLSEKLKHMAQERSDLLQKLSEVESSMMNDRQQLEDARFDKERHQLIVEDYERRNKELAQKLTLAEKKLDDAQAEITKMMRMSEQTKATADIVGMKYEQLQHTLKGKDEQIKLKEKEATELTEMFQASMSECKQKEKEVHAVYSEKENILLEAKVLGSKLHAVRQQLSSVEQERSELQERLRVSNQALSKKEREMYELLHSYRELGDDTVRLESELAQLRKQRICPPSPAKENGAELGGISGKNSEASALNKHIVSLTNKLVLAEKERSKLRALLEQVSSAAQKQDGMHAENGEDPEDFQLKKCPVSPARKSYPRDFEEELGVDTPSPCCSPADQHKYVQDCREEHIGDSPPHSPASPHQFSALKEDMLHERGYYTSRKQGSKDKQSELERDFELLLGKVCSLGYIE